MRRVFFLFYFLFLLIIISPYTLSANRKSYTVFSDGKSDYVIVVSSQASESEKFAASELQSCISEISGARLPIVECGKGEKGKRIIVGHNQDSKKLFCGEKMMSPDDDSFSYKSKKGDIVIIGGAKRGTMYGVFSFLENEFGCRWLAEDCTVMPPQNEYSFSKLNHSEAPAFSMRSILYNGGRNVLFRAHNRLNERIITSPGKQKKQIGGSYSFLSPHTMGFILPVEQYYDEHPEYFALIGGQRTKDNTQPCFSNPDIFKICVEELRIIMRNYPDISIYEISTLDNGNKCECQQCRESIEYLGSYTDLVLDFVNRVADAVKDEFPNKKIEFLAHNTAKTPPVSIIPHDNVVVRLCNGSSCHVHGFEYCSYGKSKQFLSDLKCWASISNELYIWEYASNFSWYLIPFPNFYALRDNLLSFQYNGINGVFIEGNHYSGISEFRDLRVYVLTKLLWNPNCDFDKVIDDFMKGYYGEAAPYMRQYFDFIHSQIEGDKHMDTFASYLNPYYTDSLVVISKRILNRAKLVTTDELITRRIEVEELTVEFLQTIKKPVEAKKDGTFDRMKTKMEKEGINKVGSSKAKKLYQERVAPQISYTSCGKEILDSLRWFVYSSLSKMKTVFKDCREALAG